MPIDVSQESDEPKAMRLLRKLRLITDPMDMATLRNVLKAVSVAPDMLASIEDKRFRGLAAAFLFLTAHEDATALAFFAKHRGMVHRIAHWLPWNAAHKHANYLELRCLLLQPRGKELPILIGWCQHRLDGHDDIWIAATECFFKKRIASVLVFRDPRVALLANAAKRATHDAEWLDVMAQCRWLLLEMT